ncbi:MAG: hypothetical protein ACRD3B_09160, partial [Candidatus Sulfotelmatobacter sp.]
LGRLEDDFGLDWWELTVILVHQEIEIAFLMHLLAESLGPQDEVHVSRPCFQADILRLALGSRVRVFASAARRRKRGVPHYVRVFKKFPLAQLVEIFWDKTDPGYQIRGRLSGRATPQRDGVVLLPSSYVNVSRTGIAYAQVLPETRFLLVTTRRSGWLVGLPANVSAAWLRQYASLRAKVREIEYRDLLKRWELLQNELRKTPDFRTLAQLGTFSGFPRYFAQGLEIRDAWRNVFDSEPVQAVICADDTNPYTHIPLLLAKRRELPAIACHHGALDGRYMFKRSHADVVLAKGRMEEDYLVRTCSLAQDRVELGAPGVLAPKRPMEKKKSVILFISEAYEVAGGRVRSFYRDILPKLADLARSEGRELVVKLHPSESVTERSRLVQEILSLDQFRVTRVVGGALTPEMLDRAWFGVTVLSTVAVECALRAIPCFLCAWLEAWPYGYVDQFTRFDVGIRLSGPEQLRQIPTILQDFKASGQIGENCWVPIEPQRLRDLLGVGVEMESPARNQVTKTA